MTLDASNEKFVGVRFRVLNEVDRCLFRGDGDEGDTFIGWLEPDDLGALDRSPGLITTITLTFATFGLLFLLGSSRGWAEQAEGTREQLSGHTFDNCDDVTSELGLDFVGHFLVLEQHQSLAFNLDVVFLLVILATGSILRLVSRVLFLFPLLLLLLLLRCPNLVDIEQLNSDNITLESAITILRAADVDVGVQDLRRDVCIGTVTLVDTKDTDDELPSGQERGERSLGEVGSEQRFTLWLAGLLLQLGLELLSLLLQEVDPTAETHHIGSHHVRKHVRETEGRHLVVMTARGSTELLQAGKLSLSLSEILRKIVGLCDGGGWT